MAIDYNILFNTETNVFYKHGGTLDDDIGEVTGPSGYTVLTDQPYNGTLNTSADAFVVLANQQYEDSYDQAVESLENGPTINTSISIGVNLLEMEAPNIVVKTEYNIDSTDLYGIVRK